MDVVTDHFVLNSFAPPCRVVIFLFITQILKIELNKKLMIYLAYVIPMVSVSFPTKIQPI